MTHTSRKRRSPETASVPRCTANVCRFVCRDGSGFRSMSLAD